MYYGEELKKYQIVYLDLGQKKLNSSIQVGKRYAIIVSNDKANKSAISKGTITEWGNPQYTAGSETLAWASSSVSVFVPNSNNL